MDCYGCKPKRSTDPENSWKDHEAMPVVGDAQSMVDYGLYAGETPQLTLMDFHTCFMVIWEKITLNILFWIKRVAEGQWIESGAYHVISKDPTSLDGFTTDFNSGGPYVMFKGTGYDHLMIPVEGYYDYQEKK